MAGNAHLTSPFMRFSVLFDTHNTPTRSVRPAGLAVDDQGLSTPPPVETVAWLDPNLPTPPTFAGEPMTPDESGSGKRRGEGEDEKHQEAEETAEKGIVEEMLTPGDIKADPILSDLAKQQGVIRSPPPPPLRGAAAAASRLYKPAVKPADATGGLDVRGGGHEAKKEGSTFKARPAPATTTKAITGPRLSKAAALRMGVYQPTERERVTAEGEKKEEGGGGGAGPEADCEAEFGKCTFPQQRGRNERERGTGAPDGEAGIESERSGEWTGMRQRKGDGIVSKGRWRGEKLGYIGKADRWDMDLVQARVQVRGALGHGGTEETRASGVLRRAMRVDRALRKGALSSGVMFMGTTTRMAWTRDQAGGG